MPRTPAKARVGPCLLVVDDDPVVRTFLSAIAERHGLFCRTAENGVEALEAMEALSFDIAVVDLFMPVKEGITTIIEMRAQAPAMKIIAMSGGGRLLPAGDMLDHAIGLGADEALAKPFSADAFLCVFESLIGAGIERRALPGSA